MSNPADPTAIVILYPGGLSARICVHGAVSMWRKAGVCGDMVEWQWCAVPAATLGRIADSIARLTGWIEMLA